MNIFAGNFSVVKETQLPELDLDIIQTWARSYFIMGADEEISSSEGVKKLIEKYFGEVETIDISIEWEDELEIISSEYEQWVYERVSFEWPQTSFWDILERFAESAEVICVREAQDSLKYGNRIIKADFIY